MSFSRNKRYCSDSDSSSSDSSSSSDCACPKINVKPIDKIKSLTNRINEAEKLNKKLVTHISRLDDNIDTLTKVLNETRDQVQALLDYCFTDRRNWKEGTKEVSSN